MTGWLAVLPVIGVLLLILFAPGLAIGWGLRLRGLLLWGFAPAAGTAAIAISALVLGVLGVRWSVWSAAIAVAILSAGAWLVGLALGRPAAASSRESAGLRRLVPIGIVIGAVLGAVRMGVYIGDPSNVSQTNDAVFHLNVLRFIADTGSASSLHVTQMVDSSQFYPAAWHAIGSLAVEATGSSVAVVANAFSVVLCGPVWASAMALLVWAAARGSAAVTAFGGALAPALMTAPFLTFKWGVLYSYSLSLVIAPAVCAIVVHAFWRLGATEDRRARATAIAQGAVLTLVGLAALALAQPSLILVWLIVALSVAAWSVVGLWKDAGTRGRVWMLVSLAVAFAIGTIVWIALSGSTSGSHWVPPLGRKQAVLGVIVNSHLEHPVAPAVSVLALAGLVIAILRPDLRWLATTWVALSALYFVAASIPDVELRDALLGGWYGDPVRVAVLTPIAVIPLAAIGLAAIVGWAARRISPQGEEARPAAWSLVVIAVVGILSIAATAVGYDAHRTNVYAVTPTSYLSLDEAALLARLGDNVGPDAGVIVNPSTGGAFAYALTGRDVYPRTWARPGTPPFEVLEQSLNLADEDPRVCAALDELGVEYVLDFGLGTATPGRWVMPGMTGFERHEGFDLVDREGDASLWRITACS